MHSLAPKIGTVSVFIEIPKHLGEMKTVGRGFRMKPVWPKIEAEGVEQVGVLWGGGSKLGGLGSAVRSPSWVWGRVPTAQRFSTIFSTQDGLSWHYNIIVLLWITKKMIFFKNPIPSWVNYCRKRWSSLQGKGEVVGRAVASLEEAEWPSIWRVGMEWIGVRKCLPSHCGVTPDCFLIF